MSPRLGDHHISYNRRFGLSVWGALGSMGFKGYQKLRVHRVQGYESFDGRLVKSFWKDSSTSASSWTTAQLECRSCGLEATTLFIFAHTYTHTYVCVYVLCICLESPRSVDGGQLSHVNSTELLEGSSRYERSIAGLLPYLECRSYTKLIKHTTGFSLTALMPSAPDPIYTRRHSISPRIPTQSPLCVCVCPLCG